MLELFGQLLDLFYLRQNVRPTSRHNQLIEINNSQMDNLKIGRSSPLIFKSVFGQDSIKKSNI